MLNVPKETGEIFDKLSKGAFISSNAVEPRIRKLYEVITKNQEALSDYFAHIDFILETGNEYYFFSRIEAKQSLENKIKSAYKWIDIYDFLMAYDLSFAPGFRFIVAQMVASVDTNALLKSKIEGLRKHMMHEDKSKVAIDTVVESMIRNLENNDFIELESDVSKSYKVLASFQYLENLINLITIPQDVQYEIPQ
ncbi:MAG: hypothetical protein RL329_3921 [Bacteroidota bacterium]|jgi:hypothetical protein